MIPNTHIIGLYEGSKLTIIMSLKVTSFTSSVFVLIFIYKNSAIFGCIRYYFYKCEKTIVFFSYFLRRIVCYFCTILVNVIQYFRSNNFIYLAVYTFFIALYLSCVKEMVNVFFAYRFVL